MMFFCISIKSRIQTAARVSEKLVLILPETTIIQKKALILIVPN